MSFVLGLYHHSGSIKFTFKDNSIQRQMITSSGYSLPSPGQYSINNISSIHTKLVDYVCKLMNNSSGDPNIINTIFTDVLIEFINYINSIIYNQDKIIDELKEQLAEKIDENDRLKKEIKQVQINFKTFEDEIIRLNDIIKKL
jgi:uncharacterized coiled-coil protein SlyX